MADDIIKIKTASVKIMRSHDYCHFEVCLGSVSDDEFTIAQVDDMRKAAARLADKAVEQYKIAKEIAEAAISAASSREYNSARIEKLREIPDDAKTPEQKAQIKAYDDEQFRASRRSNWDYNDDWDNGDEPDTDDMGE